MCGRGRCPWLESMPFKLAMRSANWAAAAKAGAQPHTPCPYTHDTRRRRAASTIALPGSTPAPWRAIHSDSST